MSRSRDYVGDIPVEVAERLRLKRREEKARKLADEGHVMNLCESGLYLVANGKGKAYRVDLAAQSCTCPDHQYRGVKCKHIQAAETFDLQRKEEIWMTVQKHPQLRLIGNGSLTNADTSRWHRYERAVLGLR